MARTNSAKRSSHRHSGRHRTQRQPREPYLWLGASAITLGLGAAMASGTAVSHADTTAGASGGQSTSARAATAHPTATTATSGATASSSDGPGTTLTDASDKSASRAPKTKPQASSRKNTKSTAASTGKVANASSATRTPADAPTLAPEVKASTSSTVGTAAKPTAVIRPATATNLPVGSTPTTASVVATPAVATAPAAARTVTQPTPTATTAAFPLAQLSTGAPTVPVQAAALLVAATALSTRQTPTAATALVTTTTGQPVSQPAPTAAAPSVSPSIITTIPVGSAYNSVVNPSGTRAYVAGAANGAPAISVIDTATNTVTATITTASGSDSLALSPTGDRLYAGSTTAGTVTVIDTATNAISATIHVASPATGQSQPLIIATTQNQVYVANPTAGNVSYISTANNTVSQVVDVHGAPSVLAVSSDGKQLYVGMPTDSFGTSGAIRLFDTTTGNLLTGATLPATPWALVFSPDGTKLYVASSYFQSGLGAGSFITIFNTATMAQVPVTTGVTYAGSARLNPDLITGMVATPDGAHVYLAESSRTPSAINSGQIAVFDTATNSVATTIAIANATPMQIATSPDSTRVYVNLTHIPTTGDISAYTTSVGIIDTATNSLGAQTLSLGPSSAGRFTLSANGTRIYVASPVASTVTVVDTGQADPSTGGPKPPPPITVGDAVNASMHALFESIGNAIGAAFYGVETAVINVVQQVQPPKPVAVPTTAQGLYERLRQTTDTQTGIWIDKVTNGGKISYVVYLGGTQLNPSDQQNIVNNIPSALHVVKSAQLKAIVDAITAPGGDPNAPIMLVGFSQGGLDAQNLAQLEPQLNVKSVVMFAAPLVYWSPSDRFTQIDLVATGDPVPALTLPQQALQQLNGHVYGPAIPSDYWNYTAQESLVAINPFASAAWKAVQEALIALAYHGDKQTYSSVGYLFDHDKGYKDIKASIANFSGNVVQTWPAKVPSRSAGFA